MKRLLTMAAIVLVLAACESASPQPPFAGTSPARSTSGR